MCLLVMERALSIQVGSLLVELSNGGARGEFETTRGV